MKHTPAPWHPIQFANYWRIYDKPFYEACDLMNEEKCNKAEANAKLAAAAPELLENLKRLIDRMEENELGNMSAVTRAKEAILKATT